MTHSFARSLVAVCLLTVLLAPYGRGQFGVPKTPAPPKTAKTETLTLKDIISDATFVFDIEGFKGVEYKQVGNVGLDDFFKSSAKLEGVTKVAAAMKDDVTTHLRKYAQSHATDPQLKGAIAQLTNNAAPDAWTDDQCVAVERLAKEKGKLSQEESAYFQKSGSNLAIMAIAMNNGVKEADRLIKSSDEMLNKAKSLEPSLATPATTGVTTAITSLKEFVVNTPPMAESFTKWGTAFGSL